MIHAKITNLLWRLSRVFDAKNLGKSREWECEREITGRRNGRKPWEVRVRDNCGIGKLENFASASLGERNVERNGGV